MQVLIRIQTESSESSSESEIEAASLSFGELARAQASLQNEQSSRPSDDSRAAAGTKRKASDALEQSSKKSRPSELHRPSKHAPQTLSSKYPVSRARTILSTNKSAARDPRFDPLTGILDATKHKQNYSFLNDYRANEISSLKATLKALDRRKGLSASEREAEREDLKRAIQRLTSKAKAEQIKEKEREVISHHRKEERDKVKEGKQPFFLKNSELKKRVEEKRFEGVGEKRKERIVQKRKKKKEAKEKRLLPKRRIE